MMKKILIGVGVLAVLVIIGIVLVWTNLDKIVRVGTEKVMTYVLQVPVTVGSAKVKLTEGSIQFNDIVIPNPPGYSTDRAMTFGVIKAQADIKSFTSDQPIIKLVQMSKAEITMEARRGGSNLQDLMNNASRLSGGGTEQAPPPKEEPKQAGKSMKIETVLLDENTVRVAIPFLGGKTVDVPLPKIEMRDIGGKEKGATPAEAMQLFLAGILDGIKKAGTDILPTEVLADLTKSLKELPANVQQSLSEAGKQVQQTATEATKQAQEAAKGATTQTGETVKQAGTQVQDAAKSAAGEASKAAGEATQGIKGLFGSKKTATATATPPGS